jgi:hypothetical protein
LLTALAVGEGDAAGDGLGAGLGLVAAGAAVSPAGEDVATGDDVVLAGEFVLVAGSQAAANAMTRIVVSKSVARLVSFIFGLLIVLPRWNKIEKRGYDYPGLNFLTTGLPTPDEAESPLQP